MHLYHMTNSHFSLVTIGYLNRLFKYRSRFGRFFDWSDNFYSKNAQSSSRRVWKARYEIGYWDAQMKLAYSFIFELIIKMIPESQPEPVYIRKCTIPSVFSNQMHNLVYYL